MDHKALSLLSGLALAVAASGCGTPPETTRAVAQADLAVRDAAAGEAPELASAELQLAREKLARAERARADGDDERARRLAEQALVDAQLAEARAESETAAAAAREVEVSIDALQRAFEDDLRR
jgi:hypothetical protein